MNAVLKNFEGKQLTGRNRRLLYEWQKMEEHLSLRKDIDYSVVQTNSLGLPTSYQVIYHIKSISGISEEVIPQFSHRFVMQIDIPENYPCIDALPYFHFLTHDEAGNAIPHPWHPNIRYYGEFAGRVCINMPDTYTELVWGVERVAHYLRYDLYHAIMEPPYPEDLKVADWVYHVPRDRLRQDNDVDDVRGSGHFKGTGPVKYMHSGSWDWDSSYYFVGGDATNMRITKLIITYMNGTQKVLNRNMLRFNASDDED